MSLFQIVAVFRKPAMRSARNMFIVNLAVADLLLCTVTMPLTLMEILTKYFPLGNNPFVCKTIGILQATSTYVSTISITAIALDRYQVSDCVLYVPDKLITKWQIHQVPRSHKNFENPLGDYRIIIKGDIGSKSSGFIFRRPS